MCKDATSNGFNGLGSSALADIQKNFEKVFCPDAPFGFSYIRSMAHTLIEGLMPFFVPDGSAPVLEEADLQRLECLAISAYLDEWLENDENATQTLHSFADENHQYMLRSERKRAGAIDPKDHRQDSLKRANSILTDMQELRAEQAETEGSSAKPLSPPKNGKTGRIWYNFISLRFMELYAQRNLTLFELLALRKEIMCITSQKKSYEPLKEGYQNYSSIFKEIESCENNRKYVISCMQMQKMESTYRFQLCAEIAKYALNNGICIEKILELLYSDEAKYVWGRYNSPRLLTNDPVLLNQPLDILNYKHEIECVFNADTEAANKIRLFRVALMNVIDLMNLLSDPRKQRSWEDNDFDDAAKFFRDDYPISACGTMPDKKELSGSECQCICKIYNKLAGSPEMPFYNFREEMQAERKKRNSHN